MLLLVAVNDKGHVPVGSDAFVDVGLTGALLAELAMGGQLTIAPDGTVQAGQTRPGDELLASVYDAVREHLQGRKAKQVIRGLSRRIAEAGIVSWTGWPTPAYSAGTSRCSYVCQGVG